MAAGVHTHHLHVLEEEEERELGASLADDFLNGQLLLYHDKMSKSLLIYETMHLSHLCKFFLIAKTFFVPESSWILSSPSGTPTETMLLLEKIFLVNKNVHF